MIHGEPTFVAPDAASREKLRAQGVIVDTGVGKEEWIYGYITSESAGRFGATFVSATGAHVTLDKLDVACKRSVSMKGFLRIQLMISLNLLVVACSGQCERLINTLFQHSTPFWNIMPVKTHDAIRADRNISRIHEAVAQLIDSQTQSFGDWIRRLHKAGLAPYFAAVVINGSELPQTISAQRCRHMLDKRHVRAVVRNLANVAKANDRAPHVDKSIIVLDTPDHVIFDNPSFCVGNMMDEMFVTILHVVNDFLLAPNVTSSARPDRDGDAFCQSRLARRALQAWRQFVVMVASTRCARVADVLKQGGIPRGVSKPIDLPPLQVQRVDSRFLWRAILNEIPSDDAKACINAIGRDVVSTSLSAYDTLSTIRLDVERYLKKLPSRPPRKVTRNPRTLLERMRRATYDEQTALTARIRQILSLCTTKH